MIDTNSLPPAATSPMYSPPAIERGLVGRVLGVLTSPRDTYTDIAQRPRWAALAAVVLLLSILPTSLLMSTEVGQHALLDQQIQLREGFGLTVNDAQYQILQRVIAFAPYLVATTGALTLAVGALGLSGLLIAIWGGVLGGNARFVQVFATVTASGVVLALRTLFAVPLDYARESLSSPTALSAVLPFFEDNTFGARLLGSIDLFVIWWLVNLAIGVGVIYKRRTFPIAATMLVVYVAIGLAVAIVRSLLSGA